MSMRDFDTGLLFSWLVSPVLVLRFDFRGSLRTEFWLTSVVFKGCGRLYRDSARCVMLLGWNGRLNNRINIPISIVV